MDESDLHKGMLMTGAPVRTVSTAHLIEQVDEVVAQLMAIREQLVVQQADELFNAAVARASRRKPMKDSLND